MRAMILRKKNGISQAGDLCVIGGEKDPVVFFRLGKVWGGGR